MTTTESTRSVPEGEILPEAAPRVVSPSSSLSPPRSSALSSSLSSSVRRRKTGLAVETSEALVLPTRMRTAKRKREREGDGEAETGEEQQGEQQRSVRQNTQPRTAHGAVSTATPSPALAPHTPTHTLRALTTPTPTTRKTHRTPALPIKEEEESGTGEEKEEDKSLQLAHTHREMVRTSASLLRNLAFSLDFSVSLSHTHALTQASVSASTCVDSYDLLTQREFGIDRELARALSDRQREKEERRHLIMRDFFGQGLQSMFARRERTKLVDSMLHIAKRFLFEPQIAFHAVSFVDQYLSRKSNVNKHDLLEIGIAALMIAFKLDRGNRRKFPLMPILLYCHFDDARDREIFAKLVLAREVSLFSAIGLDPFNTPSLWEPLCEQLSVLSLPSAGGSSSAASSLSGEGDISAKEMSSAETQTEKEREEEVSKLALCLCERMLFEYDLVMGYWPSTLVCAAIIVAQSIAGAEESVPRWSALLLQHTGLQAQDLLPCVLHVQRVLREESLSYAVVYAKKYLRESRARIATVKSGSESAARFQTQTQTQTPTHEREAECELASFFDYDEFIAMIEKETPSSLSSDTNTHNTDSFSSSSSSSSASESSSQVEHRAYLACLPGLLNALLADSLLSCVFLDAHNVSESAGTSRCTTTESVAFSATFSPDRSAHTNSSSSNAVLSAFSPMLSFSPTPAHRHSANFNINNTSGSAVCVKRGSDVLLQEEKERERERHQWLSLSRSLSRTIESVSEEEREPLKSVRLRHRAIYRRLVCCPPLY